MIKYGIPMQRVLEMLYNQASMGGKAETKPQAVIFKDWLRGIQNGQALSKAVGNWIPDNERMMIEAGEESQSLSESLDNLVEITQGMRNIKSAVVGGVIYPIILLCFIIGVLNLFSLRVFPEFDSVYPMEKWTGLAGTMVLLVHFVKSYLNITIIGIIAVFSLISFSMTRWTGEYRKYFDKIPPWSIYRLISGAGFLMSLGALINSGVQTSRALEKIGANANPWMKERVMAALHYVYSGLNVGRALKNSGYDYPDKELIEDLVIYSDLPSFSEMLDILGKEWLTDTTDKVKKQANILNGVALFLLFGVIGWLFSGLYAIVNQIQESVQSSR